MLERNQTQSDAISVPPRGLWAMLERWPDDVNDRGHLIEVAPERRGAVVSTCMQGRGCSAIEVAPERWAGGTQMHSDEQTHSDVLT
jgi:hypothetical protein